MASTQLMVIKQQLANNMQTVTRIVPKHVDAARLMRVIYTAIQQTPDLAICTPESLIQAALMAAALGLWPNDGQGLAWIIPYGRRAQLIPGYRGLLTLARQASGVGAVDAGVVYEGDTFDWEEGRHPILRHVPARVPAFAPDGQILRPIIAAWMVAQVHGTPQQTVMLRWEIDRIQTKSAGAKRSDSPWRLWPDRMSLKTVVRRGCKLLPTSAERLELAQALAIDDAAETGKSQAAAFVVDAGETLADAVPDPDADAEQPRLTGEIQRPTTTSDLRVALDDLLDRLDP